MKEIKRQEENPGDSNANQANRKFEIAGGQDLPDTPEDEEKMKPEEIIIDLPDVTDIPGQEHVRPPRVGMLADTTISSDDEEGIGLFGDENDPETDDDLVPGTTADVTEDEKTDLQYADESVPTKDEINLRLAALDSRDDEGEPLNEKGFGQDVSGSDIDIPGAEIDNANEDIGEEDEENNPYSLGNDDDNSENDNNLSS